MKQKYCDTTWYYVITLIKFCTRYCTSGEGAGTSFWAGEGSPTQQVLFVKS